MSAYVLVNCNFGDWSLTVLILFFRCFKNRRDEINKAMLVPCIGVTFVVVTMYFTVMYLGVDRMSDNNVRSLHAVRKCMQHLVELMVERI